MQKAGENSSRDPDKSETLHQDDNGRVHVDPWGCVSVTAERWKLPANHANSRPQREKPLPPSRRTLSVWFVPSVRQSAPSTRNRMQNSKADLFCYPSELSRIFVM